MVSNNGRPCDEPPVPSVPSALPADSTACQHHVPPPILVPRRATALRPAAQARMMPHNGSARVVASVWPWMHGDAKMRESREAQDGGVEALIVGTFVFKPSKKMEWWYCDKAVSFPSQQKARNSPVRRETARRESTSFVSRKIWTMQGGNERERERRKGRVKRRKRDGL